MAKAAPSDDSQKPAAAKGRANSSGGGSSAPAVLDERQLALVEERRKEAEAYLAQDELEAAGPILLRLAKLPYDSTRETSLWARQQLQRVRKRLGAAPDVTDSVAIAGTPTQPASPSAESTLVPPPRSAPPAPPSRPEPAAPAPSEASAPPSGESPAARLKAIALSPPVMIGAVSAVAFLIGLFATAAAVRPPKAVLHFDVDEDARRQDVELGLDGHLHPVLTLGEKVEVAPGRQTLSVVQTRIEWATLDVELEDGDDRTVRVVYRDGHPEVHLLGSDGSVLAKSLVPKPLPPPEPEPPKRPIPQEAPKKPSAESTRAAGTKSTKSGPTAGPQDDTALATALLRKGQLGMKLSVRVRVREGNGFRYVLTDGTTPLPNGPLQIVEAILSDDGLVEADVTPLKDALSLQALTLTGSNWTGDEIRGLEGHPTLARFTVRPKGSTFTSLKPCAAIPHLVDCPKLEQIAIESATVADEDAERLKEMKGLQTLTLVADRLTIRGLAAIAAIPDLGRLQLKWMDPEIDGPSDTDLQPLNGMAKLISLDLEGSKRVTGTGFDKVALPELRVLRFTRFPALNDAGVRAIATAYPRLNSFSLNAWNPSYGGEAVSSSVTNATLGTLRELSDLQRLAIHKAEGLNAEGFGHLVELKSLKSVDFSACDIKDDDVESLAKLPLTALVLSRNPIGDAACKHLASASSLRTLALDGTLVTDEGILPLKELKNLSTLWVQQTAVTNEGIEALKRDLPKLAVNSGP